MPRRRFAARFLPRVLVVVSTSLLAFTLLTPVMASAGVIFKVTGGGYGHGIGLSQYGAQGLAARGWGYRSILYHYYANAGTRVGVHGSKTGTHVDKLATRYMNVLLDPNATSSNRYTRTYWTLRAGHVGSRLVIGGATAPLDDFYSFTAGIKNNVAVITVKNLRTHAVLLKEVPGSIVVKENGSATPGLVQVYEPTGNYGANNIRYRGNVVIYPAIVSGTAKLKIINQINIEQYLYGVVPREMPASWRAEALKSQAVAARGYAHASTGEIYCTTKSQAYCGHSYGYDRATAKLYETANAAVDGTNGLVLKYARPPDSKHPNYWDEHITAFFSSSTGGRTAAVQDVWSGDSKPYLTSVADYDQAGPDYRWDPISFTGVTMASKLRSYDAKISGSISSPYPAQVTSLVVTDRASSGHVRRLTAKFSDGKSYSMSGGTFRSAADLKSNKFYIARLSSWYRFQESDSRAAYKPAWNVLNSKYLSGGSYRWHGQYYSKARFAFKGYGVRWVTTKAPGYGKAHVYLDNVYQTSVNLYSPTYTFQNVIWSKGISTSDSTHTVEIRVLKQKDIRSFNYAVGVDAIDVDSGTLVKCPPIP